MLLLIYYSSESKENESRAVNSLRERSFTLLDSFTRFELIGCQLVAFNRSIFCQGVNATELFDRPYLKPNAVL